MKKLICLILTVIMLISSASVFAREYLPDYEDMDMVFRFDVGEFVEDTTDGEAVITPNMKRMQFLEMLGIWDDASKSENAFVTMTEFSIIMSRLRLGKNNALESVYLHNETKENATYRNAYMYLIEALGYSPKLKEYEGGDNAFLIVANQLGLISQNPENVDAYITRGELAELIIKALKVDMCVIEYTDYGYMYNVAEGKTLLNSVHGIHEISGFVNAVEGLSVFGGVEVRKGCIQIDRRNVSTSGLNLDKYLGAVVTAYTTYDEATDLYSIISIDYAEGFEPFEIDFEDIVAIRGNRLIYMENDEELDVVLDYVTNISQNGEALASFDEFDYRTNEGKIAFVDSDKDDLADTAIIYQYNYYISAYADAVEYRLGLNCGFKHNGLNYIQLGDKDVIKLTIDGVPTPFEKLPANLPFRIFRCEKTGYTEIVAVTGKLSGSIEAKDEEIVQINGEEYTYTKDLLRHIEFSKNNPQVSNSQRIKELELGAETTFFVFGNKVVCYSSVGEFRYGYLKSVSEARTSIEPDLTFRIFTQDGEWDNFTVSEKLEVDGKKNVSKEEVIAKINANIDIINSVIRYKANSKNELLALDTVIEDGIYENDADGETDDIKFVTHYDFVRNWTGDWISLSSPYFFSSETIIFVAPVGETREDKFRVVGSSQLPGGTLPMKFYNPNEYNQITLAVCTVSFDNAGSGGDSEEAGPFYYVEGIRNVLIDADQQLYGYRVMVKKFSPVDSMVHTERIGKITDTSFIITSDLLNKNFVEEGEQGYDSNKKIEVGDLIEATVVGGEATAWSMHLKGGVVGELTGNGDYKERKTFDVFAKGKVISVNPAERIMVFESEGVKHPAYMNVTAVIDTQTNKVRLVSASDFHEGDIIYTYVRYGRMYFMVKNE